MLDPCSVLDLHMQLFCRTWHLHKYKDSSWPCCISSKHMLWRSAHGAHYKTSEGKAVSHHKDSAKKYKSTEMLEVKCLQGNDQGKGQVIAESGTVSCRFSSVQLVSSRKHHRFWVRPNQAPSIFCSIIPWPCIRSRVLILALNLPSSSPTFSPVFLVLAPTYGDSWTVPQFLINYVVFCNSPGTPYAVSTH